MGTRILAATMLVLLVAALCTLAYAVGDVVRWLLHHSVAPRRS